MKKLLIILLVVMLTSCGSSDPIAPAGDATLQVSTDPATQYVPTAVGADLKFEKGEKIRLKLNVSAPAGVQLFYVKKIIGNGEETDVTSSFTAQGLPSIGVTSYEKVIEATVAETYSAAASENKVTLIFYVKHSQMTTFASARFKYEVVPQGQGGGGGSVPFLRPIFNVILGAQQASTAGSYFISALNTTGVKTEAQASALSNADKQLVDITFGMVGTNANYATGTNAITPQIISPDARAGKLFSNPLQDNSVIPAVDYAKATTFKVLSGTIPANLTGFTSSDVQSIDHTTGASKFVTIAVGNVISFKNTQGTKGFLRVKSLTGSNDSRIIELEVLRQQP